uniref:Cytoplasmic tRNA 2-thiolation protein 2 n=1 Tax=Sus scrofa TaxID=9823 RepID=A0A8D1MFI5_PIG
MCEVDEDYGEPSPEGLQPSRPGREQKCVKCKEGLPVVVIRAGDAFCRDCFKAFYTHKFRAVLGKNRLIFPGEKVLLAWSGGPSSSSMVWQVLEGLSRDSAKRLRFVPGVIYVDGVRPSAVGAASLCPGAGGDRGGLQGGRGPLPAAAVCPRGREGGAAEPPLPQGPRAPSCNSHGDPDRGFVQTLRLSEDADGQGGASADAADPLDAPRGPDPRLLQSDDGRQLHTPGRQAPDQPGAGERGLPRLGHGRDAGCPGPGPSCLAPCPRTASGASVSGWPVRNTAHFPQGFSDERHGDVVVVRPMREHTLKEVAFYNRLFAVPSVFTPAIDTKAPEKASVHRLMEAFLLRLQARFPSTVSTVYRTSEKLLKAPRDGFAAGPPGPRCLLCMCALDVDTADSATAFGAQTTSHVSPTQPPVPEAGAAGGPCCCAQMGGAQGCCREAARACVIEQLCYGCRVNLKDMPSLDPLPPYILAEAQLRSQRPSAEQEAWASLLGSDEEAQVGES